MPDEIDKAIAKVEAPPQAVAIGIRLPSGRQATFELPIPLAPEDLIQLFVAVSDIATGRIGGPMPEGDSPEAIRSRLTRRGLALPQ